MKKIIAVALATVMMLVGLVGLGAPASATYNNLTCTTATLEPHRALTNGDHINMEITQNGRTFQVNAYVDKNIGGYQDLGVRIQGNESNHTYPLTESEVNSGVLNFEYVKSIVGPFTVKWVQFNDTYFNQDRSKEGLTCGEVVPPKPEQPKAETRTKVTDVCKAATRVTDHYTTEYVWSDSAKAWVLGKEKWSHKVNTPLSASECGYETVVREKVTIDCKPGGKNFVITDNYKREWSFDEKAKQWVLGKEVWVGKSKVPATDTQCPPPVIEPTPEPTDPEPTEPPTDEPTEPVTPEPTDPPTTTPPTEEPTEPPVTEEPTEEPTEPPVVTPEPTEPPVIEEPSEEPTEPVKTPPATETPVATPTPVAAPEQPVRSAQRQAAPAPAVETKVERKQAPVAELAHTGVDMGSVGLGAVILLAIGGLLFGASRAGKRRQD